ncbi:bifunctional alpha/beta hydrolase/OsmC family protein [Marinoscillum luteum]|uniref:Alpha/beta fold hydrolase n=1 Tax=Marinoscillum luteum TaxID=861051 RepID=A0ABW7NCR7_9BACT
MRSQKVSFVNKSGQNLSGRMDFPLTGKPKAFVLFAHCFTCSSTLKALDHISSALTQNGMAVLRFDFTGLGQSGGEFEDTNFSSNLSDLTEAYEFLEKKFEAPQILIGHSLGGAAVLHVAGALKKVKAVVTIGAPSNPTHVKALLKGGEKEIRENGEAEVNIGGRPFKIKKQFLEDLEKDRKGEVIRHLGKALLVMHSPQDKIVGIDNAAEIYQQAMHPKSFITLDGSDHLLSRKADSHYVGNMVSSWASRYIVPNDAEEVAPEGEVWTRLSDQGFLTEITAGKHHLLADEPEGSGGTDHGPSPYGYLLSALGACTAMTLRMYADYKKIDLKEVKVKLTHDKVHQQDGGQAEAAKGKIDQIRRMIRLEGDLTDAERKRLIEIADRCPVHKTLEGKPQIITEEATEI